MKVNEYLHELKLEGRTDETIDTITRCFKRLLKIVPDINNPYEVKEYLAEHNISNATKNKIAQTVNGYYKFIDKTWTKPKYTVDHKFPYIPTEQEINALISNASRKYAPLLQMLKETGMRTDEAHKLEWTDLDPTRKTISITASKRGNGRILPISDKLLGMLNTIKNNESTKIFPQTKKAMRNHYYDNRRRTATKLANPRILKIRMHTFRHYKGTMEYHKTKDIIHVKTVLGHRNIQSTMQYINIESALFLTTTDEWTCRATTDDNEATQLIEAGFEYVMTTPNGLMQFRKRK